MHMNIDGQKSPEDEHSSTPAASTTRTGGFVLQPTATVPDPSSSASSSASSSSTLQPHLQLPGTLPIPPPMTPATEFRSDPMFAYRNSTSPILSPSAPPSNSSGFSNPWQNLFASSGAPTPSLHPPDSPFSNLGQFASSPEPMREPFGGRAGGGGGAEGGRRGSLGPNVNSMAGMSLSSTNTDRSMMPPPSIPNRQADPAFPPSRSHENAASSTTTSPRSSPPASVKSARNWTDVIPNFAGSPFSASQPKPGGFNLQMSGSVGGAGRRPFASASLPHKQQQANNSRIRALVPIALQQPIPSTTFILDLRPHHNHLRSRVKGSIPINVPTTLLRRPNFTVEKLYPMLGSEKDRNLVKQYKDPSKLNRIIAYDGDSTSALDSSIMVQLLMKFDAEGFKGELCWIKGGFAAVEKVTPGLVDQATKVNSTEETGSDGALSGRYIASSAFQNFSTTINQTSADMASNGGQQTSRQGIHNATVNAANPFFDNIRQNAELSQGIIERIPLDLPTSTMERLQDLPPWLRDLATAKSVESMDSMAMQFYKIELGEQKRLQTIMQFHSMNPEERGGKTDSNSGSGSGSDVKLPAVKGVEDAGRHGPRSVQSSSSGGTSRASSDSSQRPGSKRVRTTSTAPMTSDKEYFPYSITAGIEKGAKNRYKNIWPFDHARIRLEEPCHDDGSDYINASIIHPRGTKKSYIATQGPLPTTYQDFWTLCWEQNVRVIVMLTKQVEGGQVKCGDYWSGGQYGPLMLQHVSTDGGEDVPEQSVAGDSGFFFGAPASSPTTPADGPAPDEIITRVFNLTHIDYPNERPRQVTQLQYTGWPDFGVPASPDPVLKLIGQMNDLQDKVTASAIDEGDSKAAGPVVVHCSAGVGRTGSFVVVDAVLDAIRRERRLAREQNLRRQPSTRKRVVTPDPSGQAPPTELETTIPGSSALPGLSSLQIPTSGSLPPSSSMDVDSPVNPPPAAPFPGSTPGTLPSKTPSEGQVFFMPHTLTESTADDPNHEASRRSSVTHSVVSTPASSPSADSSENDGDIRAPREQSSMAEDKPVTPLSSMKYPLPMILEDLRQQRMSLCQTLRQYVFSYRLIIQGILDIVDEERGGREIHDEHKKRQASPTELRGEPGLHKRGSIKMPLNRRGNLHSNSSASSTSTVSTSFSTTPSSVKSSTLSSSVTTSESPLDK